MTREQICNLPTPTLIALIRSINPLSKCFAIELIWAKNELAGR